MFLLVEENFWGLLKVVYGYGLQMRNVCIKEMLGF